MSDIEHYSWCQAAQNQARPRSMQLIGPKCECREFRDSIQKSQAFFEAWLETEEGENWLAKLEAIVDSGVLDTGPPAPCRICGGDEANHATYSHQYKPDTDREGQ